LGSDGARGTNGGSTTRKVTSEAVSSTPWRGGRLPALQQLRVLFLDNLVVPVELLELRLHLRDLVDLGCEVLFSTLVFRNPHLELGHRASASDSSACMSPAAGPHSRQPLGLPLSLQAPPPLRFSSSSIRPESAAPPGASRCIALSRLSCRSCICCRRASVGVRIPGCYQAFRCLRRPELPLQRVTPLYGLVEAQPRRPAGSRTCSRRV
jgi:hypothetical protein